MILHVVQPLGLFLPQNLECKPLMFAFTFALPLLLAAGDDLNIKVGCPQVCLQVHR